MSDNKPVDTANEPVDTQDDSEFMDTGVLHEPKPKNTDDKPEEAS